MKIDLYFAVLATFYLLLLSQQKNNRKLVELFFIKTSKYITNFILLLFYIN